MEEYKNIFKQIKPWIVLAAVTIALYSISQNFKPIFAFVMRFSRMLTPLYYGLAIAFILNIPMKKIENFLVDKIPFFKNKGITRAISITLSIILALLIISVVVVTIVPQLYESIVGLINNLGIYAKNIETFINQILNDLDVQKDFNLNNILTIPWTDILNQIKKFLEPSMVSILNNTKAFTGVLANIFMGFMLSLYLLSGKEMFICQSKKLTLAIFGLKTGENILKFGKRTSDVFENFIGGQLVECVILSLIFYIGLSLFKMPYALLISVATGVLGIIPIFGAMLAMLLGAFLIFAIKPIQALWFIVLYQCLQQFENNVIYPRVVGNSVGLQGIWVLLSIIIFGDLFGGIGMIVAVPSMAVIYVMTSEAVNARLKKIKNE